MIARDIKRLSQTEEELRLLNIGATAVGTAINVNPIYLFHIIKNINLVCGTNCAQAEDLFDATQNLDGFVHTSGALKTCAVNLSKICNDLRLLSSGPRTGIGEINLPPKQNGSSIMPGKINPVIPEVDVYKRQVRFPVPRPTPAAAAKCGNGPIYTLSIRYPIPTWVWIYWGEDGSFSIFLRSVAINTRSEATSLSQELPHTSRVI